MEVTPEILEIVKENIFVTWNDEDDKVENMVKRGMKRINNLIGGKLDYSEHDNLDLLVNFCRYDWNGVSEYFTTNFQDDILFLQIKEATKEVDTNGES